MTRYLERFGGRPAASRLAANARSRLALGSSGPDRPSNHNARTGLGRQSPRARVALQPDPPVSLFANHQATQDPSLHWPMRSSCFAPSPLCAGRPEPHLAPSLRRASAVLLAGGLYPSKTHANWIRLFLLVAGLLLGLPGCAPSGTSRETLVSRASHFSARVVCSPTLILPWASLEKALGLSCHHI